jgi:hypothetical protein
MPRTDAGHSSRVEWIAISIVVVVSAVVDAEHHFDAPMTRPTAVVGTTSP